MTASSIKQPFQSGYFMDISRCIEWLEIARSGHFNKSIKRQLSVLSGPSLDIVGLPVYTLFGLFQEFKNF
jgi:hypothetical protein